MSYLGLDIGSSSIKGAVLDPLTGTVSRILKEPFPEPVPGLPPLHFEVDPVAIVSAVRRLMERLSVPTTSGKGIVSCGQMGGVILVDRQRRPLTNYLSWRDQRTTLPSPGNDVPVFVRLQQQVPTESFQSLGCELQPGSMSSLLVWLKEQGRLPKDAIPLSLGDFVMQAICGAEPVSEPTEAIGTFDLKSGDWHHAQFAQWEIDQLTWPKLQRWTEPVGSITWKSQTIPVFPTVGDHQCALGGVGLRAGELSLNISTGSQVALLTPNWTPGDYQTRVYLDERFLNTITHIPAGRALNVLVDLLTELATAEGVALKRTWDSIARTAAASTDNDLDVNLAFFAGPLGDRGRIQNITTENLNVGSLFRAAFRHMADNYAILAKRLSPNQDWQSVVLSGRLAQNIDILRQFLSERFAGSHRLCTSTEDTLLGLLTMARVHAGLSPTFAAACEHFQRTPPNVQETAE